MAAARRDKPLPRLLCQRTARDLLRDSGWVQTQGGKHVIKMEREGSRPITLPAHHGADYSLGLTRGILKAAGLWNQQEEGK